MELCGECTTESQPISFTGKPIKGTDLIRLQFQKGATAAE